MSSWSLLPVLLLSPPTVEIPHPVVRRIVGCAVAFPIAMLIAAPAIALVIHARGVPSENAHIRILAERVESAWHDATTKPLRYVGGDLADGVLTYVHSRPEILPDLPDWHAKRVTEYGVALVCFADNPACIEPSSAIASRNPESRTIETQITRSFLGIPGEPRSYVVFIVPPDARSD